MPIWQRKNETATRLRGRIEAVLDWATVKGWRRETTLLGLRVTWSTCFPKSVRAPVTHASLPYEELPKFLTKLRAETGMARYALEFLILCASRTGEVVGAQWEEIDLAKGTSGRSPANE